MRRWGVDSWILDAFPIERALILLQENGFECLEYSYEHFKKDELSGTLRTLVNRLRDLALTLEIRALQMHAPYGEFDAKLGSSDEAVRSKALKLARDWLEYASALGVPTIVFHTARIETSGDLSTEDYVVKARSVNERAFSDLAKLGRELGVKVAVENRLEKEFGSRPSDLLRIVEQDPDNLGICFDTGHANVNGFECGEFVEKVGNRLIATHVHDNDGRSDLHLLPYMGNINWDRFFNAIANAGYDGPFIIEVPGSSVDQRLCLNKVKLTRYLLESPLL